MSLARKAKLYMYVAVMLDMTVEERVYYCQKEIGCHYAVVYTDIENELGIKL